MIYDLYSMSYTSDLLTYTTTLPTSEGRQQTEASLDWTFFDSQLVLGSQECQPTVQQDSITSADCNNNNDDDADADDRRRADRPVLVLQPTRSQ